LPDLASERNQEEVRLFEYQSFEEAQDRIGTFLEDVDNEKSCIPLWGIVKNYFTAVNCV